jgi:hypothetical protein
MLNRFAVFFQVFQNGDDQLLSRAWLIDTGETHANVAAASRTKGEKEPWNGEYYVSYGGGRPVLGRGPTVRVRQWRGWQLV